MRRKIYLLLIIIILTIEFCIVFVGDKKHKETKMNVNTIEFAGTIIHEQEEINIDESLNTDEVAEETIEDEEMEETIVYNDDIGIETDFEDTEVIDVEIIEESSAETTFDEDTFIDGHLKEYPAFRRKIRDFNYK